MEQNVKALCDKYLTVPRERILIKKYDWGCAIDVQSMDPPFDYIFVSDCVLPKLYPIDILLEAVDAVMGIHTIAFFSYEHRPFTDYDPRYVRPEVHVYTCVYMYMNTCT